MKKNNVFIVRLIKHIITLGFICYLLFKTIGIGKIVLIPFIICGISIVGKDICLVLNKTKQANIFNKVFTISFFIFWYGVLIFGSYLWIKEKQYSSLIFTIPFWLIGIYFIYKRLIQKKDYKGDK